MVGRTTSGWHTICCHLLDAAAFAGEGVEAWFIARLIDSNGVEHAGAWVKLEADRWTYRIVRSGFRKSEEARIVN